MAKHAHPTASWVKRDAISCRMKVWFSFTHSWSLAIIVSSERLYCGHSIFTAVQCLSQFLNYFDERCDTFLIDAIDMSHMQNSLEENEVANAIPLKNVKF